MKESIFPFISSSFEEDITSITSTKLDTFCEYAYDFENNCLCLDSNNKQYFVYRNEALKIWIYKALRTKRYGFVSYSEDFGNEMFNLISTSLDAEVLKLEIKRYITEALMFNSYINEVSEFQIDFNDEVVLISFYVESIYGGMNYTDEWKEGVL